MSTPDRSSPSGSPLPQQPHASSGSDTASSVAAGQSANGTGVGPQAQNSVYPEHHQQQHPPQPEHEHENEYEQPPQPRSAVPPPQRLEPTPATRTLDSQDASRVTAVFSTTPKDKPLPPNPQDPQSSIMGIAHERTDPGSGGGSAMAATAAQEHPRYSMDRLHPSHSPGRRSTTASLAEAQEMELPRISLEQPPPYSFSAGEHGSTAVLSTGFPPPTEEHLFQIQRLTPSGTSSSGASGSGSGALPIQHQFICANPMHDQQYLLVGSGNALHSVDLTLSSDKQSIRTHIQGIGFKEIHCLEDIGLVVVIAGRNSRVRCYDYDAIKRLVSYGHSKEGWGRPVEGGKLGAVKNMIQLRVETAFQHYDSQGPVASPKSSPKSSPVVQSTPNRILKGSSPLPAAAQPPSQQQQRHSMDRSLLSPPVRSDNSGYNDLRGIHENEENHDVSSTPLPASTVITSSSSSSTSSSPLPPPGAPSAAAIKKHKQRPMSFGGLASFAQEHVMKGRSQAQASPQPSPSQSTPTSPSSATAGGKHKRFSQMASYLSQAAVNTGMAAQMAIGLDYPSEEAIEWGWDFTKLKQTKDVLALDFHYTTTTVYMTVLSQKGIDIYCRPKSARGRKPPTFSTGSSSGNAAAAAAAAGAGASGSRASVSGSRPSGSETPGRTSLDNGGTDIYEWRQVKQLYHPEAPNFMTVVKNSQDVTDIILGKGPRACVINVETMFVTELSRKESGGVIQGISKKLGFRNSPIWHSFEKIPFDVPPHILYPDAVAAMYDRSDSKEQYSGYNPSEQRRTSVYVDSYSMGRRSHDDIIQRPADQQSIHQEQLEEQERTEAEARAGKLPKSPLLELHKTHGPSSSVSSSSSSSSNLGQPSSSSTAQVGSGGGGGSSSRSSRQTRMVTSAEVLNNAFSHRTTFQLFLATCGSQSRIVDLQGEPQSPIVLEWGSFPPQKIEFLKTTYDIYVVGFEKSSIVVFSLLRAKKIKEFSKKDLIQAAEAIPVPQQQQQQQQPTASSTATSSVPAPASATVVPSSSPAAATTTTTTSPPTAPTADSEPSTSAYSTSSLSSSLTSSVMSNSGIKYLGRDNLDDDSLGIFFSYQHPRNGVSI
ncbi:hypothetical protein BGX34_002164, partial [Mortierella sp. NVP85]